MSSLEIIAEILGLIVLPAALLVQSLKSIRLILVGEILLNLTVAVSQLLLGGIALSVRMDLWPRKRETAEVPCEDASEQSVSQEALR